MNEIKPRHLLKGITYLDIINLENKYLDLNDNFIFSKDYFIDLSQVRFAELSAITKLTLNIESLIKKGSNIYIALPNISLTEKENNSSNYSDELKINILNSRRKVNNFLKTVGFIRAIREMLKMHPRDIFISEEYQFESEFNLAAFQEAFSIIFEIKSIDYFDYKYVFPLEWISIKKGLENLSLLEERIDKILENTERGLEHIDVQGIKNVILSELIKNVKEHSNSDLALFTIGLIDSNSLINDRKDKKINPVEKEYLNWLKEDNVRTQVEIYFGDTGRGILSSEFEEQYVLDNPTENKSKSAQLKWAFQKWSTLKNNELRRGTKGLYRIQRIVNKYNGIFHITTSEHNGGFRKGGLIEEDWIYRKSKVNNEGTFIQIKLCPFAEVKNFRFTLKQNATKRKWKTVQYKPTSEVQLLSLFKKDIRSNANLLVIINLKDLENDHAKLILEKSLPEFSYDSHPSALVIYLLSNLKNDTLQIITESSNEYIIKIAGNDIFQESSHPDAEEVYDPVLVIGDDNKAFWYGGNQDLINLLNESYRYINDDLKISQLEYFKNLQQDVQIRIRLHLENDNKLVIVDRDEKLIFNFTSIDTFFRTEIVKRIKVSKHANGLKYCSPKLQIIDNWLDVKDLLINNNYGYALTLYLKFKKSLDFQTSKQDLSNCFILIDHSQQKELAKAFASLYGINHKNIKISTEDINPDIPRRTKLFPEKSNVIILTTIISSSETVRRLVKFIKRDMAFPVVILCLCNYRKYNIRQLETWDDSTNIISIFQQTEIEQPKLIRDRAYLQKKFEELKHELSYISPAFIEESNINPDRLSSAMEPDLRSQIIDKKALYYSHIGIFRDRHFTFYLDKWKLLSGESTIWKMLSKSIESWKIKNGISKFSIYVPKSLFAGEISRNNFYAFLSSISTNIQLISNDMEYFTERNIVYIDFGIISGKSVNNIITRCKQVQNLLISIIFNQSKNNEFEFYKKIDTLNNEDLVNQTPTKFQINYLYKLSLGFFSSENCPICEHSRALESNKINLNYMYVFSEDRQERLKLIESDELINSEYPSDFYYSSEHNDHELSSELVVKMFEVKSLLDRAEEHTQWRIAAYNYVYDIYSKYDEYLSDCNSKLFAFIYYLSNEINWLQKDPLVFRDFREMITDLSYRISSINTLELADKIKEKNASITTPLKLSVRFKYSGISLLRSSNKLKFCQSISEIIDASFNNGRFSNNLLQNTFYHIISLYKNRYNKSNSYYNAVSEQLNLIRIRKYYFSPKQSAILNFLEIYNNVFYIASDVKVIKSLKKYRSEYYSTNHPFPDNCMSNMNLSEFVQEGIKDIQEKKEQSTYYKYLRSITDDLEENWIRVSNYIYSTIQVHTQKLSTNFKNSTSFQTLFLNDEIKNIFDDNYLLGFTDEFSILVHDIKKEPLQYLKFKQQYDSLHNKIYKNIISRDDSKFSFFISQFPADLIEVIDKRVRNIFPKLNVYSALEKHEVFYPNYKLKEDLYLTIDNIKKRLNEHLVLSDVSMAIDITELNSDGIKYLQMQIKYDSTDEKNNQPSKKGALSIIKKEIENFGGSLYYPDATDENGFFILKFNFLKYE